MEELDKTLFSLSLGGRTFPAKDKHPERPDAINVLTLISAADRTFSALAGEKHDHFRDTYDFLSEFCHPNMLGLTIASEIPRVGTIVFFEKPQIEEKDLVSVLDLSVVSAGLFFQVFDESLELLRVNEELPELRN